MSQALKKKEPFCPKIWAIFKPIIHWVYIHIVQRLRDRPGVMWFLFVVIWGSAAYAAGAAYSAKTPRAPLDDVLMEGAFTAIQMIVANSPIVDTTNSWWYAFQRIGQFVLPFLGLLGLIDAASRLGEGHEEVKRKTLLESKDIHNYFLGYGNFAHSLARKYLAMSPGQNIVAVDTSDERLAIAGPQITPIHADAEDDSLLSTLNLKNTKTIYLDVGSDEANYRISRKLEKLLPPSDKENSAKEACKLQIFVHIGSSNYEKAIDALNRNEIRCFSLGATASRLLLGMHPPVRTREKNDKPVHILLAGYGWMGDSLLREIIKTCHYQDHRPPHITIVHEQADRIQKEIEQEYPFLRQEAATDDGFSKTFPIAKLRYIKAKPERLTTSELKRLKITNMFWQAEPHPVNMAYVITDDDILNNVIAKRLEQLSDMSKDNKFEIVQCANQTAESQGSTAKDLFDITSRVIELVDSGESYPGKNLDDIGKELHAEYEVRGKSDWKEGEKDGLWKTAEAWERNSSNASADHLWLKIWAYVECVKVEVLGNPLDWKYWKPEKSRVKELVGDLLNKSPEKDSLLAAIGEMEHRRFCAERLVAGWQYWPHQLDPAKKKEIRALRLNETLKPFGKLDNITQDYSIDSFKDAAEALQKWCSREDKS